MARLTIEIPDGKVPLVLDAIGYTAMIDDGIGHEIPNPLTPTQFTQRWTIRKFREAVYAYLMKEHQAQEKEDRRAAVVAARAEADEMGIT